MEAKQIIVALDGMERDEALVTAWTLSSLVWGFKVNDLLLAYGLNIIRDLKCLGKVFADPKLYDIPKTVENSVCRLSEAGADFITVHASGGKKMIQAALDASTESKIIAVTALTSFNDADTQEIYGRSTDETVWDLAHMAVDAGAHGIVCSAKEIPLLTHLNTIKIVPGVRAEPVNGDDQSRTGMPVNADFIVVGRPITSSQNPIRAVERLLKGINNAEDCQ